MTFDIIYLQTFCACSPINHLHKVSDQNPRMRSILKDFMYGPAKNPNDLLPATLHVNIHEAPNTGGNNLDRFHQDQANGLWATAF